MDATLWKLMLFPVSPFSIFFETAVELYDGHKLDSLGRCSCLRPYCNVAYHAAEVIWMAGVDYRLFDIFDGKPHPTP